jgi:hypothetical protein
LNTGTARIIQKYDSFGRNSSSHFYKESGVIHDIRYHKYYSNPKGKEGKQTLHVEFDSFYRPISVDFIK